MYIIWLQKVKLFFYFHKKIGTWDTWTLNLSELTLSQTTDFRLFQTERVFADDNFKFD